MPLERLTHRHVGQAVLLGSIDHLDLEAGTHAHAIQEGLTVLRLAHGAGRNGR